MKTFIVRQESFRKGVQSNHYVVTADGMQFTDLEHPALVFYASGELVASFDNWDAAWVLGAVEVAAVREVTDDQPS